MTDTYPKRTDQPDIKAIPGENAFFTKINPPPVSGIAEASSAYVSPMTITKNPPIKNAIILPKKPAVETHSPDKTTHPHPSMAPIARKKTSTILIDLSNCDFIAHTPYHSSNFISD